MKVSYIFRFFIFTFWLSVHITPLLSIDVPYGIRNRPDNYYNPKNLDEVTAKHEKKHAPCLFLIDQFDDESHSNFLQDYLAGAILSEFFPIITTFTILERLLKITPTVVSMSAIRNFGKVYDVPNSQFILLIPRYYEDIYHNAGFSISNLAAITTSTLDNFFTEKRKTQKKKFSKMGRPLQALLQRTTTQPFSAQDLGTIFSKNDPQAPILDFITTGHGGIVPYKVLEYANIIANLSVDDMNAFLSFINNNLACSTVYLATCYAAGTNISLLQEASKKMYTNFSFIIVTSNASDAVQQRPPHIPDFYYDYFDAAARLQDRGDSLNQLLKAIDDFNRDSGIPHGTENIPQVLLPYGLDLQTFNISKSVFILGNVLLQRSIQERTAIDIKDKKAVLVYPNSLNVPLQITPLRSYSIEGMNRKTPLTEARFSGDLYQNIYFYEIPTMSELIFNQLMGEDKKAEESFTQFIYNHKQSLPILHTWYLAHTKSQKDIGLDLYSLYNNAKEFLFPQFIAMHHNPYTYFEGIELQKTELVGIFKFIRDAFLNVGPRTPRESKQMYLVQSLTGMNDLSVAIELTRAVNKQTERFAIEPALDAYVNRSFDVRMKSSSPDDRLLTLTDLIITVEHSRNIMTTKEKLWVIISFILDGIAWEFKDSKILHTDLYLAPLGLWNFQNFKKIDAKKYKAQFERIASPLKKEGLPQPTIIQTLESKKQLMQERIQRKEELPALRTTINTKVKALLEPGAFEKASAQDLSELERLISEYRKLSNLPQAYKVIYDRILQQKH